MTLHSSLAPYTSSTCAIHGIYNNSNLNGTMVGYDSRHSWEHTITVTEVGHKC